MSSLNDQLLERLKAVECRDATFAAKSPSLVMAKAKGSLVYDAEGREYIDLCAGFGALALGHHPEAQTAIYGARLGDGAAPINHAMGDVYPSVAKVELIETLAGLLPKELSRIALALTGAQAVELAVKTAILATKRSGFIAFQGGYHGLDLGILPLTSREDFRAPFKSYAARTKAWV
jgi:4-aminobutyrate aminotransferase-like enzyme